MDGPVARCGGTRTRLPPDLANCVDHPHSSHPSFLLLFLFPLQQPPYPVRNISHPPLRRTQPRIRGPEPMRQPFIKIDPRPYTRIPEQFRIYECAIAERVEAADLEVSRRVPGVGREEEGRVEWRRPVGLVEGPESGRGGGAEEGG